MDKKLLVFSIFVSLFILGGLSLAEASAGASLHAIATRNSSTNTTFGNVVGGTSVKLNFHGLANNSLVVPVWNITVFYNSSASGANRVWSTATLTAVSGNTTCSGNICNKTSVGGSSFQVTWTLPTTDSNYALIARYIYRNGTKTNYTGGAAKVSVDNTKPTITLTGPVTDAFVFVNLNRFVKNGIGINYTMIAKVTDQHVRNCTLFTEFGYNQKNTFASNKTGVNTVGGRYGFLNMTGTTGYWNATHHFRGAVPNAQFKWGVSCYDNATTPNRGVASTNRTFYFDNKTPRLPATNALTFDDSDPNSKDTSTSGLFRVGGVWTSELLETLTFTCDVTEENLANVKFHIKRPGSTVFDLEKLSTKKTLEFKDTSKTGIYEVKCTTTDIAGNATTSSAFKFRLQAEDEGEVTGTQPYVKPFNVDFSKVENKVLVEPEGRILTVSFDGSTEHTIKFDKVTASSVTLTIESTPQTLSLNIGESRNIDVNEDGVNDFSVRLTDIIDGKASVEFKKLSGAEQVAREESQPTTSVRAGTTPTTQGRSTTGIWIIVLIVVVGVIIYLLVARRKKKQ